LADSITAWKISTPTLAVPDAEQRGGVEDVISDMVFGLITSVIV